MNFKIKVNRNIQYKKYTRVVPILKSLRNGLASNV